MEDKTQDLINEIIQKENIMASDEKAAERCIKEYKKKLEYIELIAILDNKGYVIGATTEIPENVKDCSAKPYFTNAMQGQTYISKEYISCATGNYNITVAIPITSEGTIMGVLMADININEN